LKAAGERQADSIMVSLNFATAVMIFTAALSATAWPSVGRGQELITWKDEFRPIYPGRASYPRVAQLSNGTLLATFAHSAAGTRVISSVTSKDGGRTWGNYREIVEHKRPVDLDNAFPLQLPDGTLLVAYRNHSAGAYRLEVHASADHGDHWAMRGTIATGREGLWEPFLLLLPGGPIQAYYASEEGLKPDQRIEMKSSSDGGKTWGSPVVVAEKKHSRDGMPGVVRLNEKELLAVFEAQDQPPLRFVIRGVRSADNGRSWSTVRELIYAPQSSTKNRWAAGAPSIIRIGNKGLAVSFQSDEQVSYAAGDRQHDPTAPGYDYVRHSHFAYLTSSDDGKTWSRPDHLLGSPERPASWNALYELKNGTILALSNFQGRVWSRIGSSEIVPAALKKPEPPK
jgi:Neuraminidase (sialidase)